MRATKKVKFLAMLEVIALEIEDKGMAEVEIEDGEMAYILRKAAAIIGASNAPDNLEVK